MQGSKGTKGRGPRDSMQGSKGRKAEVQGTLCKGYEGPQAEVQMDPMQGVQGTKGRGQGTLCKGYEGPQAQARGDESRSPREQKQRSKGSKKADLHNRVQGTAQGAREHTAKRSNGQPPTFLLQGGVGWGRGCTRARQDQTQRPRTHCKQCTTSTRTTCKMCPPPYAHH